jgi:hypothetical protein
MEAATSAITAPSKRPLTRKQVRRIKRETKAREYRAVALAGGGKREVARRSGATYRQKHGVA